jgi:hypothetical protein
MWRGHSLGSTKGLESGIRDKFSEKVLFEFQDVQGDHLLNRPYQSWLQHERAWLGKHKVNVSRDSG